VVTFRLDGTFVTSEVGAPGALATGDWGSPYLYLTTDLGMWFDLPVGLKNTFGYTSVYSRKYEVTGSARERDLIRSNIDPVA
jgi:hypothetical protein